MSPSTVSHGSSFQALNHKHLNKTSGVIPVPMDSTHHQEKQIQQSKIVVAGGIRKTHWDEKDNQRKLSLPVDKGMSQPKISGYREGVRATGSNNKKNSDGPQQRHSLLHVCSNTLAKRQAGRTDHALGGRDGKNSTEIRQKVN